MPIDEQTWDRCEEIKNWKAEVLEFLQTEHPKAYSGQELEAHFDLPAEIEDADEWSEIIPDVLAGIRGPAPIQGALNALVEEGLVEQRILEEDGEKVVYYRAV